MVVDDHDVVRDGLRALLSTADIAIVAEASTEEGAVHGALQARPDLIIMDVRLGSGSGIAATREIRSRLPSTRVLILTSYADDDALIAATMAGASGYILKEVRGGELLDSIRKVARGEELIDGHAGATDRVARGKHLVRDLLAELSPREERILEGVARGRTNREIAADLDLAEKTVKNYVSTILSKLEVTRRAEAAAYLARHTHTPGS